MTEAVTTKRNGYSLEADLQPIIDGKVTLPNAMPIAGDVASRILHYTQMHCGTVLRADGKKEWNARFFLDYGQGGQLYGSGLVAWTEWKEGAYRAVGMKFAICEHKQISAPGANPSRGWHPGFCEKCGLDMTIDSGD
jgi:hypothetical protein